MRKYWKLILYSAPGVVVLFCIVFSQTRETGDRVAVNIRIEGIKLSFFDKRESIPSKANELSVKDILEYVQSKYDSVKVTGLGENKITAVNGDENGSFGGTDGWYIRLNGKDAEGGIDKILLKSEDSLIICYGDPAGTGMQYPTLDTSRIREGIIRVYQKDVTVGADGKETVKETPIYGADFTWTYGEDKTARLVTDKDGLVRLADEEMTAGKHAVTLLRTDEKGMPVLLRLEPDTVIKTTDTLEVSKGSVIEEYSDQFLIGIGFVTLAVAVLGVLYAGVKKKNNERRAES